MNENEKKLLDAAETGDLGAVQALLEIKGINVNVKDAGEKTPLYRAAFGGHEEVVRILVEHGADLNAPDGAYGGTPLHCAVEQGHMKVMEFLLDKGANPNIVDENGRTTLYTAARKGYEGGVL